MTAQDLIEILSDLDPNTEIRIASQPRWPFENEIAGVDTNEEPWQDPDDCPDRADYDTDEEFNGALEEEARRTQAKRDTEGPPSPVAYILEGHQIGYLPEGIGRNQDWR